MLERLKVKRKSNDELILDIREGNSYVHSDYKVIINPLDLSPAIQRNDDVVILYRELNAYMIHKDYTPIKEYPDGWQKY